MRLIGLIYDAAINPDLWPDTIEEIRVALHFGNAAFGLQALPAGTLLLNITRNIAPEYVARMPRYSADIVALWGGIDALRALPLDEPAVLSRVNPVALRFDLTTNPYALEWARPQGLIDVMALQLARDQGACGTLSFGRGAESGPIGESEIEAGRLLIPHLQRAATINRLLDIAALARSTFAAVLDTLSVAVLLVTADLHIVHANPAADALLTRADLVRARDGVLTATTRGVARALSVAVAKAARDGSAIRRKGLGIAARREDGSAAALHVLPLRPCRWPAHAEAMAAVFIADTNAAPAASMELIAALFGLTPAEARVFAQIVAGRTVAEIATRLSIQATTVRTHLLRLYDKTGVRRQAELIQLASSLAVPIVTC